MFTRRRVQWPQLTGNTFKDCGAIILALDRYFLGLEGRDALYIANAQIHADEGIQFPSTQVASSDANNLDDYAEGTWMPVLTFAAPGDLSVNYANQLGFYTKIGRMVHAHFRINTGTTFTFTTASGQLFLTGLPFTANSNASSLFVGPCVWGGITKAGYTQVNAQVAASDTRVGFVASGSGSAASNVVAADTPSGGTMVLRGSVSYIV